MDSTTTPIRENVLPAVEGLIQHSFAIGQVLRRMICFFSGSRISLDKGTGTMRDLGLLGVLLGKELSSPEGKKEMIRFLTFPEG
jgi:hypothetical protein